MTTISEIPFDCLYIINRYCNESKSLLALNWKIRKGLLERIRKIRVNLFCQSHLDKTIIPAICQYPLLTALDLSEISRVRSMDQLDSAIRYLKSSDGRSIPHICCRKIQKMNFGNIQHECSIKLNTLFFECIGHDKLKSITIYTSENSYSEQNSLNGSHIESILNQSPNLEAFELYNETAKNWHDEINFSKNKQLKEVKLLNWIGKASTIASLKEFSHLKKLIISCNRNNDSEELVDLLSDTSLESLKLGLIHLDICSGISLIGNKSVMRVTNNLKNLHILHLKIDEISGTGMRIIGENCPNLQKLSLRYALKDSQVDSLTCSLPNLKELIITGYPSYLTILGLETIIKNCKQLKRLQIDYCQIRYDLIKQFFKASVKNARFNLTGIYGEKTLTIWL